MPDVHALLSPSASSRWLHCHPSARLEEQLPGKDSIFTREGTLAHSYGEVLLKLSTDQIRESDPLGIIDSEVKALGLDHIEMYDTVKAGYVAKVLEVYEATKAVDPNTVLSVEERVEPGNWAPGCFGTADAIVVGNRTVHVFDLKYGKGVKVDAKGNTQMRIYAAGALKAYDGFLLDVDTVSMSICQPRLHSWSTDTISKDELVQWCKETLLPAAIKATRGEGSQEPGAWCRWCKAAPRCHALQRLAFRQAKESFDAILMTEEELAESMRNLPIIKAWCNSVEAHVLSTLMDGTEVPGYKLVEGTSRSKITDTDKAANALLDAGYLPEQIYQPLSLIGMTEMKKLLKKDFQRIVGDYISKPQGKPTIATSDDPREPFSLKGEIEKDFNEALSNNDNN